MAKTIMNSRTDYNILVGLNELYIALSRALLRSRPPGSIIAFALLEQ